MTLPRWIVTLSMPFLGSIMFAQESPSTVRNAATYAEKLQSVKVFPGDEAGAMLSVSGIVRSLDGAPIAAAVVVLKDDSNERMLRLPASNGVGHFRSQFDDVFARTVTDDHGHYEFSDVRAPEEIEGRHQFWTWDVVAATPDGQVGWTSFSRPSRDRTMILDLERDIQLRPRQTMGGSVLTLDGNPMSGAEVVAIMHPSPSSATRQSHIDPDCLGLRCSSIRLSQRTNERGRFEFSAVPSDVITTLLVNEPGHVFRVKNVMGNDWKSPDGTPRETVTDSQGNPFVTGEVEIVESPLMRFAVIVKSTSGSPIASARVMLSRFVASTTDTQGRAEFVYPLGATPNTVTESMKTFTLSSNDGIHLSTAASFSNRELVSKGEVEVVMNEGVTVSGVVFDRESKTPLQGISITIRPVNMRGGYLQSAKTDSKGEFKVAATRESVLLTVDGPFKGYDLPDRQAAQLIRSFAAEPTLDDFSHSLDLTEGVSPEQQVFLLDRRETLTVRVVDEAGNLVPNASVRATHVDHPPGSLNRGQRGYGLGSVPMLPPKFELTLAEIMRTSSDGIAVLELMKRDFSQGRVLAEHHVDGESWFGKCDIVAGKTEEITVILERGWVITGRLTINFEPAENLQVQLGRRVRSAIFRGLQNVARTTTNEHGYYRFTAPADGDYTLMPIRSPLTDEYNDRGEKIEQIGSHEYRFPVIDLAE